MIRFKLDWERTIQAIDFIAAQKPNLTQFFISKIVYLADKEHLLDYGRPITGDRIVAMPDGPVPSAVLDIVKGNPHCPPNAIALAEERLEAKKYGKLFYVRSKGVNDFSKLSGSDKEYLAAAVERYGSMSFDDLWKFVHEDAAYKSAWAARGDSQSVDMDVSIWLNELENPALAKRQLEEAAACKNGTL